MKSNKVLNKIILAMTFLTPVFGLAESVDNKTIINQLEAPAYWQFPYSIHTVGQAIV